MSDDSEEKTLPPSDYKLRKAREKGQVASSDNFVSGITTTLGIFYVLFNWQSFFEVFSQLYTVAVLTFGGSDPSRLFPVFLTTLFEMFYVLAPFMIIVIVAGVVANILEKQGIPFSLEPIKPDFGKINPGQGLKKLFSRRNATEFSVALVKLTIWFSIAAIFIWLSLQTIMASAYCSIGCVLDSASAVMLLIMVAAIILLMFTGLIDIPLQHALFRHEQKMGHKELKREMKEILGSPEFKSHRRREHQKILNAETTDGVGTGKISHGTDGISIILRGYQLAVGIYFHQEHADVPHVVSRFSGPELTKSLRDAEEQGIPVVTEEELAKDIFRSVEVGKAIHERHFEKVAQILVRTGIIG